MVFAAGSQGLPVRREVQGQDSAFVASEDGLFRDRLHVLEPHGGVFTAKG